MRSSSTSFLIPVRNCSNVCHLELVEKRKNVFITLLGEESGGGLCGPEGHGKTFHTNFERRIAVLAEWFQRNAKPEDLGGNDPKIIARLLFGMAFGLLHEMRDSLQQGSFVSYAPILTEFFFHGVSSKLKTGVRKK